MGGVETMETMGKLGLFHHETWGKPRFNHDETGSLKGSSTYKVEVPDCQVGDPTYNWGTKHLLTCSFKRGKDANRLGGTNRIGISTITSPLLSMEYIKPSS